MAGTAATPSFLTALSGQRTFGKKSRSSQGKIKGFFKIAFSPTATEAHIVGSSVGRIDRGIVESQNL
jgi:hypothetical protein